METFITLTVSATVIIVCELVLWMLFMRKVEPLVFPHELDASHLRFFSIGRLRIIAITHAIVMFICAFLFYLFLW